MIITAAHKKHATVRPDVSDWCGHQLSLVNNRVDTSDQTAPLNGLVLCGGKSTRMGRDKGGIQYHDTVQREYVYRLLSDLCDHTFLSCNAQQAKEISHLPVIEDSIEDIGPAGGILSAFAHYPQVAWLTVACDLPYINEAILHYLIEHRNPLKMATAFWDAEGRFPEPLITIWEPRAYAVFLQFIMKGYTCPRKVLINTDVAILQAPDTSLFANINTREEYEAAKQKIDRQQIKMEE